MSHSEKPRSSGGSSWLVVLLVILGLIVLTCGGLCAGGIYVGQRTVATAGKAAGEFITYLALMPAFAATQQAVNSDLQVRDRLGEPINAVAMPTRENVGVLNPKGETFQYDITGPKGTAIVSGVATGDGTTWRVSQITVTFSDGSVVNVSAPENQPSSGEFKFDGNNIRLEPELNEPIEVK